MLQPPAHRCGAPMLTSATGTCWRGVGKDGERCWQHRDKEIRTELGWRFICQSPDCGGRSPALRETRAQAEEDQAAHNNIIHEGETWKP